LEALRPLTFSFDGLLQNPSKENVNGRSASKPQMEPGNSVFEF